MKKEYMEMIQTIEDTASEMEMLEIASTILNNLFDSAMYKIRELENYKELINDIDNFKWDWNNIKRYYYTGDTWKKNEIKLDKVTDEYILIYEYNNYKQYMEKAQYNELKQKYEIALDKLSDEFKKNILLESIKDTLKTIDYLKGATQEHYKNSIIGIICFEKGITPNIRNWDTLESIYYKWFDSGYQLINELFNDGEYDLFNEKERELLGL